MDEPKQSIKNIPVLSWKIATEPRLYRDLASNPYTPRALQIISERFPDIDVADVVEAVVLAEPEGLFDRNFNQLTKIQQEEELRKLENVTVGLSKRLVEYCNKYTKEFKRLPKEFVYDDLTLAVFETTDVKEIEQKYSQKQRRDFKLSIVNFIESKKKDRIPRWISVKLALAALSVLFIFFLIQRYALVKIRPLSTNNQNLLAATQIDRQTFPVRLKIPSINVDASVEQVSVASDGSMEVPHNSSDVGWYNLGPKPGEIGSAVIAGHVDGIWGQPEVFADLYKLKSGDKILVEDVKGTVTTFVVRESRTFDPGFAAEVFNSQDGVHLNLITCDGVWNGSIKSYSKRLVVFTDLVQ